MHARVRVPRRVGHGCGMSRGPLSGPEDVVRGGAVGPRPRLGGVGEGEPRGVNDAVASYQGDGHLGRLPDPQPFAAELGDVRDYAQHGFLASETFFGLFYWL